ncbi:MAG: hypothetical protein M1825_000481 [Sarcosagium campestre]|nr:MAG: hypothetical protein M1825_000481 [Sarcosagium campestre]
MVEASTNTGEAKVIVEEASLLATKLQSCLTLTKHADGEKPSLVQDWLDDQLSQSGRPSSASSRADLLIPPR